MSSYDDLVEKSIRFLKDNNYSKSTISFHRVCYRDFREYLDENTLIYTNELANSWLEDNKSSWDPKIYCSRRKCLKRLEELQKHETIVNIRYTSAKYDYDLLEIAFRTTLDEYLISISEHFVENQLQIRRRACSVFLMFMQKRNRKNISEIEYEDLIAFHQLNEYKSKTIYECYIREFLSYAATKSLCSRGFSILLNPKIIHRAVFLERFKIVDPQDLESIRIQSLDFSAEEFLDSIESFILISKEKRYCPAFLSMARRCLLSLYIFLDINGFGYSPDISDLWLLEMRPQIKSQFVGWRRILEVYKEYSIECDFCPDVVYSYKPDSAESIPYWIKSEFDFFVSMKQKEGISKGSIITYKNAIIRFSKFLEEMAITDFDSISAETLIRFNHQDSHKTAKGKCTYNSSISVFIEFLEDRDVIKNKYLHQVLPRKSAQTVMPIEILTDEELEKLDSQNSSTMSPIELRDNAMILVARRLGFRESDIVDIEYSDIDWKNATISTLQRKTKKGIVLPLPNDVRNAIVRYMKYGRPYSKCPKIFIKHKVPYNGLTGSSCAAALSRSLYGETDHPVRFHRTRRSFGTGIVRGGAAHDIASKMLGHNSNESLKPYFSADEEKMRTLPLSLNDLGIMPKGGLTL